MLNDEGMHDGQVQSRVTARGGHGLVVWRCDHRRRGESAAGATATVPAAPAITAVKAAGLNSITVAFAAPGDDGGTRIVSYRATCTSTDGGVGGAHNASRSPIRVPSLTGNATYTCTVSANNAVGSGPASTPSLQGSCVRALRLRRASPR